MIVLSNILLRYKEDLKSTNPKWIGIRPLFQGYSFGQVVVAAANNFRHHDEWARTRKLDAKQKKNIEVISFVLKSYPLSLGASVQWRRNACVDLLHLICANDFTRLETNLFEFAKAMCI